MEPHEIIFAIAFTIIFIIVLCYLISNQKKKVIEWLKWAVTESEKALGSGTGQLKLHTVYDWFCKQFPHIASIIPFVIFSSWVDTALVTLDDWLNNDKLVSYVGYEGGTKHMSKKKGG